MKSRAPISGFDRPSRASCAICSSCAVSSSRVSTVRLRTLSPVACSSRRARSAKLPSPSPMNMSCAVRNCSRRVDAPAIASKPLAVEQVSPGELGAHPCSAQMLDRLTERAFGGGAFAQRARERASTPSAQSDPVACAFLASRFRASVARSVLPVRVAGSTSSLKPQFSATTSWYSLAERAATSASSYWPKPLQRTARAYSAIASPIPSPRAPASRCRDLDQFSRPRALCPATRRGSTPHTAPS